MVKKILIIGSKSFNINKKRELYFNKSNKIIGKRDINPIFKALDLF